MSVARIIHSHLRPTQFREKSFGLVTEEVPTVPPRKPLIIWTHWTQRHTQSKLATILTLQKWLMRMSSQSARTNSACPPTLVLMASVYGISVIQKFDVAYENASMRDKSPKREAHWIFCTSMRSTWSIFSRLPNAIYAVLIHPYQWIAQLPVPILSLFYINNFLSLQV
jgi:hypothetical protein